MKYDKMVAFARHLPMIRWQVQKDLALPGLPPQKVAATVVRLLEARMMRVVNEEYARQNNTFGVATLRARHVGVAGPKIRFEFRGKSGVQFRPKRSQASQNHTAIPGPSRTRAIQIYRYLRNITGEDFTSKDFRTWREPCWPPWHCVNLAERKSKLRKKYFESH